MAKPSLIVQAVSDDNHAEEITDLLTLDPITWVLVSVAYLREDGWAAVEAAIRPVADRAIVFAGIRNDLTSIQAVKRLLGMNVQVYAVDTATRRSIYHPKLYVVANDAEARAIVGSANLTFGGMYNNIEVSAMMELDCADEDDAAFLNDAKDVFQKLMNEHPDHVFRIRDAAHAEELFTQGRLADESVIPPPSTGSTVKRGSRDSLDPMKLYFKPKPKPKATVAPPAVPPRAGATVAAAVVPPLAGPPVSHLVWQSNALSERDLNVPSGGPGTHKTGSMGFKKGAWEMDDLRHYFRDEVFKGLAWTPKDASHERAIAKCELIIKGVNYGTFELELGHDTRTNTRSYEQHNMMTDIKWGEATKYIAKRDLLDRVLYLYRKDSTPPEFVIEID